MNRAIAEKYKTPLLSVLAIVFAIASLWFLQDRLFLSGKWRYRMTVTVETPEGIKTSSAVRELRVQKGLGLFPEMSPGVELEGEAVVIDLGHRGVLFSMIPRDYLYGTIFHLFPREGGLTSGGIRYYNHFTNEKAILPRDKYPEFSPFVTFKNLNDPKSVIGIDPDKIDKTFGEGVKIKEIYVQFTDQPITHEVKTKLPWLANIKGYLSGKNISGKQLFERLDRGNFLSGD